MSHKLFFSFCTAGAAALAVLAFPASPASAAGELRMAFLHAPHHSAASPTHGHQHGGCFVTTSPHNYTRGIRHWRNPCPHHHRKHLNPYHGGYHKLHPHH